MKLIVAGSRSIKNINYLKKALKYFPKKPISEIVSGKAQGVDQLGEEYARSENIPIKNFPAD